MIFLITNNKIIQQFGFFLSPQTILIPRMVKTLLTLYLHMSDKRYASYRPLDYSKSPLFGTFLRHSWSSDQIDFFQKATQAPIYKTFQRDYAPNKHNFLVKIFQKFAKYFFGIVFFIKELYGVWRELGSSICLNKKKIKTNWPIINYLKNCRSKTASLERAYKKQNLFQFFYDFNRLS